MVKKIKIVKLRKQRLKLLYISIVTKSRSGARS
jgi:hypothetical protein